MLRTDHHSSFCDFDTITYSINNSILLYSLYCEYKCLRFEKICEIENLKLFSYNFPVFKKIKIKMKLIIVCAVLFVAAASAQPILSREPSERLNSQTEQSPRNKRFIFFKFFPIFVQPQPAPVVRVAAQPVTPIVTKVVRPVAVTKVVAPAPVTVTKVVSAPAVSYQYTPVTYTYRAVVPQVSIVKQAAVVSETNVIEETNEVAADDESVVVEKTESNSSSSKSSSSSSNDDDN